MQMVKKTLLIFLVVWLGVVWFTPHRELYYKVETELEKQGVRINEATIEESIFGLEIHGAEIYFKDARIATVEEIDIRTLLFYQSLTLVGLETDSLIGINVDKASVVHSLLSPLSVTLDGNGSMGVVTGAVDLSEQKVRLDFIEAKDISKIRSQLKKDAQGWYYENSF